MSKNNPQRTTKRKTLKDEPEFRFFVGLFKKMVKEKDVDKLKAVGGVRGLAKALGVDVNYGLDTSPKGQQRLSIQDREDVFGDNTTRAFKTRASSFEYTKRLLREHILTPYIISGIITTILGLSFKEEREESGWIVAVGVWAIALLFILTSLAMDFQMFWMQGKTDRKKDVFQVTVLRDGKEQRIKNLDLLVGDILLLTKDDIVAADGVLFMNDDLFINEEIVTGESTPIKKKLVEDPFCRSGSQVTNGSGRILVTAVGEDSEFGQTMKMVTESTDDDEGLISDIMYDLRKLIPATLCLGVLVFIILLIRWMVDKKGFPVDYISDKGPVQFLILTIVIMVPELRTGYLLFVHFGLLYLTRKCAKDDIIVRKPNEVVWSMAYLGTICFDKTGTLTENRMTVVKGWFQGMNFERAPKSDDLDPLASELIIENASLNSEAFFDIDNNGSIQFVGNQTDRALLVMIEKLGVNFSEVRMQKRQYIIKNYGFNSDRKMSSAVIRQGDLLRLYNKGAAEMVLNKCTAYIDSSGSRNPIFEDKRIELENIIEEMATRGLRTLALSYVDLEPNEFNFNEYGEPLDESEGDKRGFAEAPEEDLVLLAIVGIEDPIREGVSAVVEQIKKARIRVRMITGDSLDTAKQVATECGILTDGLAIEGREFRQRVEEDVEALKEDIPELQVLARSSPSDKRKLVELLKSRYGRVAVSGDGTNDARAMKESTVGIAMGTNSTEVAREAADVVILNDNISSFLTLYLWSQRFHLSYRGYFQFRPSVSPVVWIVVLVSVCVGGETPLNLRQFLWANFIIDILVVLTFVTESPPARVLLQDDSYKVRLYSPDDNSYWMHIILQSLYQIIVIICTLYSLLSRFERYEASSEDEYEDEHDLVKMRKNSLMFNIFVFMQLFNSLNCRKVFHEYNIFEGLFNSPLSLAIRLVTVGLQLTVMLTPMRTLFKVTKLNAWEWIYSIGVSVVVIPFSTIIRDRAIK